MDGKEEVGFAVLEGMETYSSFIAPFRKVIESALPHQFDSVIRNRAMSLGFSPGRKTEAIDRKVCLFKIIIMSLSCRCILMIPPPHLIGLGPPFVLGEL